MGRRRAIRGVAVAGMAAALPSPTGAQEPGRNDSDACCEEIANARGPYPTLAERWSAADAVPLSGHLDPAVLPGQTTFSTRVPAPPVLAGTSIAIDPFSPNCEVRVVSAVNGLALEVDRPTRLNHPTGTPFLAVTASAHHLSLYLADVLSGSESALVACVTDMPPSGGRITLPPGRHVLTSTLVIPFNIDLNIEPGAQFEVQEGATLQILGGLLAGRHRIFLGEGLVVGPARIDAAMPEWFGANGSLDDAEALQAATDFHGVVRGDTQTGYRIDCTRNQWTSVDLHRMGKRGGLESGHGFSAGYWYGVRLRDGATIEDCRFVLTGDGDPNKAPNALAIGDPNSHSRTQGSSVRNCSFELAEDAPRADPAQPRAYRGFVAQSADEFTFEHNTVTGEATQTAVVGGYLFDCHDAVIGHNRARDVHTLVVLEFCTGFTVSTNRLQNCRHVLDADKRNDGGTICHNHFDRTEPDSDTTTSDAAFEFNGSQNMTVVENFVRHARRYAIISGKPDLYETWDGALAQTGPTSYAAWGGFELRGNRVSRTVDQALVVGDRWDLFPHPETLCGVDLFVADTFHDCGATVPGRSASAIEIQEGRAIRLDVHVERAGRFGLYARSWTESEVPGSGTSSDLQIDSLSGVIRNCALEGVMIDQPSRVHFRDLLVAANCESGQLRRQVLLSQLEARQALVSGSIQVLAEGTDLAIGMMLSANDYRNGAWSVDLHGSRILGHDIDFHLHKGKGNHVSLEPVRLNDSIIETTNFDSNAAVSPTPPQHLTGTTPPSGKTRRDPYFARGTIMWNREPTLAAPFGWVCVQSGRPGVWLALPALEAP